MIWILNAVQGCWNFFVATIDFAVSVHVLRLIATRASDLAPENSDPVERPTWKRRLVRGYLLFALAICAFAVLSQVFSLEVPQWAGKDIAPVQRQFSFPFGFGEVSAGFTPLIDLTPTQVSLLIPVALLGFAPLVFVLFAKVVVMFKGYGHFIAANRNNPPARKVILAALVFAVPVVFSMFTFTIGSVEYQCQNLLQTIGFSLFLYFTYYQPGLMRWRLEVLEALEATPLEGTLAHHAGLRRARIGFHTMSKVLPARLTREEFGDALERAEALVRVGERSWRVDLLWISTLAVALGNTIREFPRWLLERRRARGGRS